MSCPAYCEGSILANSLRVSEINQCHSAFLIDHEVRSLNIPVYEPILMEFSQNESSLYNDQPCKCWIESLCHLQ
jgi:hypothetical protein